MLFRVILYLFYTTENNKEPITLPDRRIDYTEVATFDMADIFEKEEVAEFASGIFEFQGIRTGIVDIATTGFTKEDLGVEISVINFTEVI
jgi:hypothetical protein